MNVSRRIRLTVLLLLVAIASRSAYGGSLPASTRFLFTQPNASSPPTLSTRPGTPVDVLLSKASEHPISVIVGLKLDRKWIPEGYLSEDLVKQQRATIDDAIRELTDRYTDKKLKVRSLTPLPYLILEADVDLLQRLDLDDVVTSMELNESGWGGLRQTAFPPLVNAASAWNAGFTGAGQTIVILDSGVDKTHPFLAGKVVAEACFSSPDSDQPAGTSFTLCPNGLTQMIGAGAGVNCDVAISGCSHGTHVAGIAAGSSNADSIWGIARNANLISIQVDHRNNDPSGCSPDEPAPCARYLFGDVALALSHVATNLAANFSIAAVNMSLQSLPYVTRSECTSGTSYGLPSLAAAVANLRSKRIAVVGITGNFGNKFGIVRPGCVEGVIDVGASTKDDAVWVNSNSSPEFDLLAPGEGNAAHPFITSSVPFGAFNYPYDGFRGTSMAAPHVAGALAILRQKSPLATPDALLDDLIISGKPLTDTNGVTKPRINLGVAPNVVHFTLVATAASPTAVSLTWSEATGGNAVAYYSIQRRNSVTALFNQVGTTSSTSYTDTTVSATATYEYLVIAVDVFGTSFGTSNRDLATTVIYSDDPLAPQGSLIRGVHIDELRSAINSVRTFAGLPGTAWTDPGLAGLVVKVVHIQELRDSLTFAISNRIGMNPGTYTDPTLTAGVTTIKAVHIDEIREKLK